MIYEIVVLIHLEHFCLRVFFFANVTATKIQGEREDALHLITEKNQEYEVKKKKEVKKINKHQDFNLLRGKNSFVIQQIST